MVQRVIKVVLALALLMAVVTIPAEASVNLTKIGSAEISGGNGTSYNLIYDSDRSLFWLDYSYVPTTWDTSNNWANTLVLSNVLTPGYTVNFSGAGWRLPTTVPDVYGYNQTGSEMGHLYYTDFGLTQGSGGGVTGVDSVNQLPFENIKPFWYWSGTEYADGTNNAWYFVTSIGLQNATLKENAGGYTLAVRPGQILLSAVPEPSTYFLLCIGLGVVGYARRRMNARLSVRALGI
jgi:PEP-CTERM motif